ncbi:hypothetical protein ACN263_30255 [Micromonospora sp. WMMD729]|uniref:hypothetical protein n=1 Tax=Micromonospora sp. WMMD729 TaxID=3404127 RepID=UPI003BF4B536
MVMVNQPAVRRHHRWSITYALGLLALLGALTTVVVLVRDPASSSTRLAVPVPAPEITVAGTDPPVDEYGWIGADTPDGYADTTGPATGSGAGGPADGRQELAGTTSTGHDAIDVRRSLFWSGIFGLTISLAGLGLVGTRRRMW